MCTRQRFPGDCFKRKYSEDLIDIHYKRNKIFVFKHTNENVQNHFGKYFRSIQCWSINWIRSAVSNWMTQPYPKSMIESGSKLQYLKRKKSLNKFIVI